MGKTKLLTKDEVKNLASLSRIKLQEDEVEKLTQDMDLIISSVETLDNFRNETNIDTTKVKFNEVPFENLRNDEIGNSMKQEDALYNAPYKEAGYFKVFGGVFGSESS